MKILQINAVGQSASTGRTCKELAEYINTRTGHRCYTAFAVGTADEYSYVIGNKWDRKLHGLLSRITGKQAHFSKGATKKLLTWMDELQPDVVHLRNLHGNYIHFPLLMQYLTRKKIPVVITLHDCWFFTGKCCHYTTVGCLSWQDGCHDCPRLRNDNVSWFRDATKKLWWEKKRLFEALPSLTVTGVSQWTVEEAKKSFLQCAQKIRRIYNWIDLDAFCPGEPSQELREQYGILGKHTVLAVASGWGESKGLSGLISLANSLGKAYTVCLVGALPAQMELAGNMCHIPPTSSVEELAGLYRLADVFVTLSPEETFGKVSAEALACGTPVVCYDSTANKELVGPGCGAVLPLGDLEGVAEAVKKICTEGKQNYTGVCRAFAQKNFGKEDRIRDYLSLYEEISRK